MMGMVSVTESCEVNGCIVLKQRKVDWKNSDKVTVECYGVWVTEEVCRVSKCRSV